MIARLDVGEVVFITARDWPHPRTGIINRAEHDGYGVFLPGHHRQMFHVPYNDVRAGWPPEHDARVLAIRDDQIVGRGTCSVIDECWTDEELRDELDTQGIRTAFDGRTLLKAVTAARRIHRLWVQRMDDNEGA